MQLVSSCARIAPLVLASALLSQRALADGQQPAPAAPPPPAAAAPPPAAPQAAPPAAPAAPPAAAAPAAAPPAAPAAPPPAAPAASGGTRDVGLIVGGALMMAIGAPSVISGAVLEATCHGTTDGCSAKSTGIAALLVGGTFFLAGGIITTIAGARQVPAKAAGARWTPEVGLSPAGGSLRWTF